MVQFDEHVVGTSQNKWLSWVDGQASNVVCVRLERVYLFVRVVIKDAQVHIIASHCEPLT